MHFIKFVLYILSLGSLVAEIGPSFAWEQAGVSFFLSYIRVIFYKVWRYNSRKVAFTANMKLKNKSGDDLTEDELKEAFSKDEWNFL